MPISYKHSHFLDIRSSASYKTLQGLAACGKTRLLLSRLRKVMWSDLISLSSIHSFAKLPFCKLKSPKLKR